MRFTPRFFKVPVPRLIRTLTLCAVLLAASRFGASADPNFLRAPYLQSASPNSIHVVWRSAGPMKPVVQWSEQIDALQAGEQTTVVRASLGGKDQTISDAWKTLRTPENLKLPPLHSAPIGAFQYEVKLSGLKPATRYFYAVYDGDRRLTPSDPSYSFTTHPVAGVKTPFRFWVIGDGGTGRKAQADVHSAMLNYVKSTSKPLDFWIHVGDMAYGTGLDVEFQSRFFESYEPTLRSSVCWPSMGNHEGHTSKGTTGIGPYYDAYVVPTRAEAGGVASGTEAYYSFDYANVHFICLDSHDLDRKPTAAMAKWLRADLDRTKADWIIAFWHHPPYTKGSHDSDKEKDLTEMRQMIMPIIESGGVDVVLTGHSHIYERSMLMDGAYAATTTAENVILDDGDGDPEGDGSYRKSAGIHPHEGTVQVVAGNAGQTLGRKGTMPIMKKIIVEHGSVIVDVSDDTLTSTMVNRNGKVRDLFRIEKRGKATPTRIANPWQAPEFKKIEPDLPVDPAEPVDYKTLIAKGASWKYIVGWHPQGLLWTQPNFEAKGWQSAPAPFGHGDVAFKTRIGEGRKSPPSVYLRQEFTVEQADRTTEMGLLIDFRDAFIAYLNGHEVARVGVSRSHGRNAQDVKIRAARGATYVRLKDFEKFLKDGPNTLALEVHSAPGGLDLLIDPILILED